MPSKNNFKLGIYESIYAQRIIKFFSWILIYINIWIVWIIIQFIFSNIGSPPPKPTGLDAELRAVTIFYVFAISLAGPVLLFVAFIIWKFFWASLCVIFELLLHRFYHPLIKPIIALGLALITLQSVHLIANGFWYTLFWTRNTFQDAHNISKGKYELLSDKELEDLINTYDHEKIKELEDLINTYDHENIHEIQKIFEDKKD
tara:strand:+ start:834 stop:1442 length:609 start_codon:yes stop_codon:yes gene_type:complete